MALGDFDPTSTVITTAGKVLMDKFGIKPVFDIEEGSFTPVPILGQFIGKIFGGGKKHPFSSGPLSIPENLADRGIRGQGISGSRYRGTGPAITEQLKSIGIPSWQDEAALLSRGYKNHPIVKNLHAARMGLWDATSRADAIAGSQGAINAWSNALNFITALDTLRQEGVSFPDEFTTGYTGDIFTWGPGGESVPQPGDTDFVGPVQALPGVDKGKIAKTAFDVAKVFLRPRRRRVGFVSTSGFGDISELEQEKDRVIPSGFIRKQATTQNRALAPMRRNALDTIS